MALSVGVNNGGVQSGVTPQSPTSSATSILQPTTTPAYGQSISAPAQKTAAIADTTVATPVDTAAAQKAADAAKAAQLKTQISDLVNTVKSIYDGRYGQVDQSAAEQAGKLNSRFGSESGQLEGQIADQNQQAGAAYAGNGTFDSSYRGNAQDTITKSGNQQIDSLGQDLKDNLATVAEWVQQQKAGLNAGKNSADTIVSQLAQETDPSSLISLRNQIDSQIATLQGQSADNNTEAQNASALESIAPSGARSQQLQVTLKSILGGNADPTTKAAIGSQLIASANLDPTDQSKLLQAFHTDLSSASQNQQQDQNQ